MTPLDQQPTSAETAFRPGGVIRRAVSSIRAIWQGVAVRRELARLHELDDRMLRDIGLLRYDIMRGSHKGRGGDGSVGAYLRRTDIRLRPRTREVAMRCVTPDPCEKAAA